MPFGFHLPFGLEELVRSIHPSSSIYPLGFVYPSGWKYPSGSIYPSRWKYLSGLFNLRVPFTLRDENALCVPFTLWDGRTHRVHIPFGMEVPVVSIYLSGFVYLSGSIYPSGWKCPLGSIYPLGWKYPLGLFTLRDGSAR